MHALRRLECFWSILPKSNSYIWIKICTRIKNVKRWTWGLQRGRANQRHIKHTIVCRRLCTTSLLPLTSEVIHEAGLGSNDPLGSRLTEDGNVVFWTLAEHRQAAGQLTRRFEDVLVGEPAVLTQDHLQGAENQSGAFLIQSPRIPPLITCLWKHEHVREF